MVLILLLELECQVIDSVLEVEFVEVVLCLKGQDLVVGILRSLVGSLGGFVKSLNALSNLSNLLLVSCHNLVLDALLLSVDIDLSAVSLVLRLEVVQSLELLLKVVLQDLNFLLILFHGSWTDNTGLEVGLLLCELHLSVSKLVVQQKDSPKRK